MAWPSGTYDVIFSNHSNWPSLNLTQNVGEGWTNSYKKRQVLMFNLLGKKPTPPPPPFPFYVRGLSHRDGILKKVEDVPGKTKILKT